MQLSDTRPPRRIMSLTPLIDVVFLLLVFFMLSSTFLRFSSFSVEAGGAGTVSVEPSDVVLIHVDQEGALRVNGASVLPEEFNERLAAIKAEGGETIVLVMRTGTKVEDLVTTLATVRSHAFKTIRVVR
ncbi:MAG: biopolymer transporter ExbD [Pseudomonadota bacterium]